MEIKELSEAVDRLANARAIRDGIKGLVDAKRLEFEETIAKELFTLKNAQQEVVDAQEVVSQAMHDSELKSWKTNLAIVTRKVQAAYKIIDKTALIASLKENKLGNEYVREDVIPEVKGLFGKMELAGVETTESEYISLRVNK
jgi:hypothetical protein